MPFVKYRKLQCHPTESISPYTLNQLNKHEGLRKQERKGRVKETMKYSEEKPTRANTCVHQVRRVSEFEMRTLNNVFNGSRAGG